jgi:GntR family transcriptional repressor for pyruvate dehydrogenase complex
MVLGLGPHCEATGAGPCRPVAPAAGGIGRCGRRGCGERDGALARDGAANLPAVERKTVSTQVAERLLGLIRDGRYLPGQRLPTERELCTTLGVGRSTVREAMRWLVVAGVVDIRPGRGAVVTAVSPDTLPVGVAVSAVLDRQALEELAEVRRLLEPEVAAIAAQRVRPPQLERMRRSMREMQAAAAAGDEQNFVIGDLAFHDALAEAAQNVVLRRMLGSVQDLLRASRVRTIRVPGAAERASLGHARIAEAVAAGDPEAARQAMRAHLADNQSDLARSFQAEAATGDSGEELT